MFDCTQCRVTDQWRAGQFISLLCSCDSALESQLPLFVAFLKVFRVQMEQASVQYPRRSLRPIHRTGL